MHGSPLNPGTGNRMFPPPFNPNFYTMKKLIYFLCCLASCMITCYMVHRSWILLHESNSSLNNISFALGTIGWVIITYNIIARSYAWTKMLCK